MPAVAEAPPTITPEPISPSTSPAPRSSPMPSKAGDTMKDAFSALESRSTEDEAQQPTPKQIREGRKTPAAKPAEAPKPEPPKKEEPAPKEEEDETPKEEKTETPPKPAETAPAKPKKPSDFLREELTKTKQERDALKAELEKSKAAPVEHPEVKSASEKAAAAEKRAKELEELVRTTAYERSQEFKEKFETPFNESYAAGAAKVKALKVTMKVTDPDTGVESLKERPGTLEDWEQITSAPSEGAAAEAIEKLFGQGVRAQMVAHHYLETVKLFRGRQQALADAQKLSQERQTQFAEAQKTLQKEVGTLWQEQIKPESVPDQWKPYILPKGVDKDGKQIDPEWDAALAKGFERYDKAMAEDARRPDLKPEERKAIIGRAAAVRNQSAAFRPLVLQLRRVEAENKELKAELAAYSKSEPGAGDAEPGQKPSTATEGSMSDIQSKLDKLGKPGPPVFF